MSENRNSYILRPDDSDDDSFPATVIYSMFLPREGENVVCPDEVARYVTLVEHDGEVVTVFVE